MCKNCKDRNARHHHKCDFDINKNIEYAVVKNGAKEHLKECENNSKKKFDYKKYIKKHKDERKLGFNDLKFNGFHAELEFPNGFVMYVTRDERGLIETVEVTDGKDWRHRRYVFDMFPDLRRQYNNLASKVDTMILSDAIRKVQELSKKDFLDFRNS